MNFEWDEANIEHIAWHDVTPTEAEEVFYDPDLVEYPSYIEHGERRFDILGSTDTGRILKVVYTIREGAVRVVRVVTAHDPNRADAAYYRRRKG